MGADNDRPSGGARPMPPRPPLAFIRPFTTHVFNPVSRLFVRWLPWFGLLAYRGRRSGKRYQTPLNVFRHDSGWVFALTYGSDVNWVKNVIAAGEAELIKGTTRIRLIDPELVVDPGRRLVPFGVRQALGVLRVSEFLVMRDAS
jgi:deazaflavin-dependent oxidoreductase (nitroreductase family)